MRSDFNKTRLLWLKRTEEEDSNNNKNGSNLEYIEALFKKELDVIQDDDESQKEKKKKILDWIILLQIQSGRAHLATKALRDQGYVCRLSSEILNYDINNIQHSQKMSNYRLPPPCIVLDNFLTDASASNEYKILSNVFQSPSADYWKKHNYAIEPPSPYVSYVIPLSSYAEYGFIGKLVHRIYKCPKLRKKFPLLRKAKFVEMWAHNRPHASGHQLHFDSDDEGRSRSKKNKNECNSNNGDHDKDDNIDCNDEEDRIRNPIISTILYLNSIECGNVGGPSLVTTQNIRQQQSSLAGISGFLSYPKPKRLVAFNGKMLHGVIPGKGVCPPTTAVVDTDDKKTEQASTREKKKRRVTLMFAFWKQIDIQDFDTPGSARPFPKLDNRYMNDDCWVKQLIDPIISLHSNGDDIKSSTTDNSSTECCVEVAPIQVNNIYEDLEGKPWNNTQIMPDYDQVFQGF